MKRLALLAMVLATLLSGTAAWAQEIYVIAGGGAVGTRISSVPYTITQPGFYYLGGNLTYSGDGSAITVDADDVTLDLMGFSLTKSGAAGGTCGINSYNRTNVEIRNGTVRGFLFGVIEQSTLGDKHRVINVRATNNGYGIYSQGITHHVIKNCNASNNNYGISIFGSAVIIECIASDNTSGGIRSYSPSIISKCIARNNFTGIFLTQGIIADCNVSNNTNGIILQGPGSVLGNTAFDNSTGNFELGAGVPTAILVDRNSAFGLSTNYGVEPGTTGVQYGTNAGTP